MCQTSHSDGFFLAYQLHVLIQLKDYLLGNASLNDNQLRFLSILRKRMVLSFYRLSWVSPD